jgi:parvulin-like peptidyl-prolyl isomerase
MLLIDMPYGGTDATGAEVADPLSLEEARAEMSTAIEALQRGEAFEDVAIEHSRGINASAGGDWGFLASDGVRARWLPAIETLFALDEGEVSGVVETSGTLFLVKCAEIERKDILGFEEIQPDLIERYRRRQSDLLTRELIAELFDEAVVRPANPGRFLRALVEAAPKPGDGVSGRQIGDASGSGDP